MKNSNILLTLSCLTVLSAFSTQANAGCIIKKERVVGNKCSQKKCLNPVTCANKNHTECRQALMNFFHNDAGALHHHCLNRCSPADYDIECDEGTQSKPKLKEGKK